MKNPCLPLGDEVAAVRVGAGIDIDEELWGGGMETVRGVGEPGTIVGTDCNAGEAGVVGANSLASESPSCVSPGGSRGTLREDDSAADSVGTGSSSFRPNVCISRSRA